MTSGFLFAVEINKTGGNATGNFYVNDKSNRELNSITYKELAGDRYAIIKNL